MIKKYIIWFIPLSERVFFGDNAWEKQGHGIFWGKERKKEKYVKSILYSIQILLTDSLPLLNLGRGRIRILPVIEEEILITFGKTRKLKSTKLQHIFYDTIVRCEKKISHIL